MKASLVTLLFPSPPLKRAGCKLRNWNVIRAQVAWFSALCCSKERGVGWKKTCLHLVSQEGEKRQSRINAKDSRAHWKFCLDTYLTFSFLQKWQWVSKATLSVPGLPSWARLQTNRTAFPLSLPLLSRVRVLVLCFRCEIHLVCS